MITKKLRLSFLSGIPDKREELVAELGAARICSELGFASRVIDNSAAYLDAWITTLKEEPTFILTVISDVEKAAQMILSKIRLAA